jgi:hypothetical protein
MAKKCSISAVSRGGTSSSRSSQLQPGSATATHSTCVVVVCRPRAARAAIRPCVHSPRGPRLWRSRKGSDAGDVPADDQGLHRLGAFERVNRLDIGHVADNVVLLFTSSSCTIWNPTRGLPNCRRSRQYVSAASYAPTAWPRAAKAQVRRVAASTLPVSLKLFALGSRALAGTLTPSTDPSLGAVDHVGVAVAACRCLERDRVRCAAPSVQMSRARPCVPSAAANAAFVPRSPASRLSALPAPPVRPAVSRGCRHHG